MLLHLTAVVALTAPDALASALECDRLVAAGALDAARAPCAAAKRPGDLDALARARADARRAASSSDNARLDALLSALAAAEQARVVAPFRVVEEALVAHLESAARAASEAGAAPAAARWPLPGLPLPQPLLPPLGDPPFDQAADRLRRSEERLTDVRMRVAEGAPESLTSALAKMERERSMLVESRLAALADAVNKDPKLPPTWWLALAGAYLDADEGRPTVAEQRDRGVHVLEKLRRTFPQDGAAGIAGLWLAAFALEDGDLGKVRRMIDEAGPFDPGLSAYYEALLAWHEGKPDDARARVRLVGERGTPSLKLHLAALGAVLAPTPAEAAKAWMDVASRTSNPAIRQRARLRAAIAWSDALATGLSPEKVPEEHLREVLLHAISRGRLNEASALLGVLATLEPTADDLPHRGLQLVDAARAAGDDATADRLLADLVAGYAPPDSPWQKAHIDATGAALRGTLTERLTRRMAPSLDAGVPLSPTDRDRLAPVIDARLEHLPPPVDERLDLARALARLGFNQRARVLLKRVREDAREPERRLAAARALIDLELARARQAGEAGAAVGAWLHGAPARPPMPLEVRALVDAQTALIERLRPESPDRDALEVDRATVRVAFGEGEMVYDALDRVGSARTRSALGLRAVHQLLAATPDKRDALSVRWARREPGPPAQVEALRKTLSGIYKDRRVDQPMAFVKRGLYARAARLYEAAAAERSGPAAAAATLGAAVCWTLALHGDAAVNAWQQVLEERAGQPVVARVLRHLADLHLARGDRLAAATALEALADRFPDDGAQALREALALRAHDRKASQALLAKLVERYPALPDRAVLQARLSAMKAEHAPVQRPAGAPPVPARAPCRDASCALQPFWAG